VEKRGYSASSVGCNILVANAKLVAQQLALFIELLVYRFWLLMMNIQFSGLYVTDSEARKLPRAWAVVEAHKSAVTFHNKPKSDSFCRFFPFSTSPSPLSAEDELLLSLSSPEDELLEEEEDEEALASW